MGGGGGRDIYRRGLGESDTHTWADKAGSDGWDRPEGVSVSRWCGPGPPALCFQVFFFFFSFVKRERFLSFSFLFGILLVTLRFFLAALPCVTASFFFPSVLAMLVFHCSVGLLVVSI